MKNRFLYGALLFLSGLLLLSACKSKKILTEEKILPQKDKRETAEIIGLITKNNIQYNTLSSKLAFSLEIKDTDEKEFSLPGYLKIEKDKMIQLSFQIPLLGIEVARISITPDSLVIIDRKDKKYLKEALYDIRSAFPFEFNYYNLQSVLLNQIFIAGKKTIGEEDYDTFGINSTENGNYLSAKDGKGLVYNFYYNSLNRISRLTIGKDTQNASGSCLYDNYMDIGTGNNLPANINLNYKNKNKTVKIYFSLSKINLNKDLSLDMNVPSSYDRITLEKVKEIINSL